MREPLQVTVPVSTVNDESVRLLAWFVTEGQQVESDTLLAEAETSKALLEIRASEPGYVFPCCSPGDDVPVGGVVAWIAATPDPPGLHRGLPDGVARAAVPIEVPTSLPTVEDGAPDAPPPRLSREARRLAIELQLDPALFPAGALIRSHDVRALAAARARTASPAPSVAAERGAVRLEPLPKRKLAELRVLEEGQRAALPASVSVLFSAGEFRATMAARESAGVASSVLIVEAARLLRSYPMLNALFQDGRVGYYQEVNVGWAVNDGAGLVVPVIARADTKALREVEAELQDHLTAYVRGRLAATALLGATFTMSDLSVEGASAFVPLLSAGQSAILGIGTESLTLTFDHRAADGRDAAAFLRDLAGRLHAVRQEELADTTAAGEGLSCRRCGRTGAELQTANAVLMPCAVPQHAYVCGFCLAGY